MQWLRLVEMVMLLFLVLVMVLAMQKIVTVKMLVMIALSMPDVFLSSGHLVYLYIHLNIALQGAQTIP